MAWIAPGLREMVDFLAGIAEEERGEAGTLCIEWEWIDRIIIKTHSRVYDAPVYFATKDTLLAKLCPYVFDLPAAVGLDHVRDVTQVGFFGVAHGRAYFSDVRAAVHFRLRFDA